MSIYKESTINKETRKVLFAYDGPMRRDRSGKLIVTNNTLLLKERYEYFGGKLTFMMRVTNTDIENTPDTDRQVNLIEVPTFNRFWSLRNYPVAKKIIEQAVNDHDLIIIRLPSTIGAMAVRYAQQSKKPYMVEVVGCPWDTLMNYSFLGKIYAPFARLKLKARVKHAPYLIYVSREFLQRRYPSGGYQVSVSDVIIDNTPDSIDFKLAAYKQLKSKDTIILATLGAIDVPYKGQEYVIKAISMLKEQGYNVHYRIAGLGDNSRLQQIARELKVEDQLHFEGLLDRQDVFGLLDAVDIYIQPSLTEGLPRAVVEAMSRGCICLGTNVGGIPELIREDLLFEKRNVAQIAKLIKKVVSDENPEKIAIRNFEMAKLYGSNTLEQKRKEFYDKFLKENNL